VVFLHGYLPYSIDNTDLNFEKKSVRCSDGMT
jgi:hypothetical protein